jgi:hypothetical protein
MFKDIFSGYTHAIFVRDKSGESFSRATDEVIAFYKAHNHRVRYIRCDAGSSENDSAAVAHLRDEHGVTIQPAAPGHQHQNPVEREVQTLIKGVSCMLLDQSSLGATWWDYAVEQWIRTANCRPHKNEWLNLPLSPVEIITSKSPDVSKEHKFPFGCPVSAMPPVDRTWKYAPSAEFGVAVGSSPHQNGSTLVFIPGKGIKPKERFDVTLLKVPSLSTTSANEHQPPIPHPVTSETPMTFVTHNTQLDKSLEADPHTAQGTLGTDIFQQAIDFVPITPVVPTQLMEPHIPSPNPLDVNITAQPPSFDSSSPLGPTIQEAPSSLPHTDQDVPLKTSEYHAFCDEPIGPVPRILRPRPPTPPPQPAKTIRSSPRSVAIALLARSESLAMALKRIPRTKANPTLRQARKLPDWVEWYAAVRKELQMLSDMGCFELVHQVPINPLCGLRPRLC